MGVLVRSACVAAVAAAVLAVPAGAAPGRALAVRGLWVPRASLVSPDQIATLVRDAKDAGITDLLVQVRSRGEVLYRSAIEPRAADLAPQPADFDPLAATIAAAQPAGLRVHAWVNLNFVASAVSLPASKQHVIARHPEWLVVPRALAARLSGMSPEAPAYRDALAVWARGESSRVEGLYLSPVDADARAYLLSVVHELVERYAIDGLHLDYARYPTDVVDYSQGALAAFREARSPTMAPAARDRLDEAAARSPTAWADDQPEAYAAFLRDRLTMVVAAVQADARAVRPAVVLSAAVVPDANEARDHKLQDWRVWARAGYFDALCPMIYTTDAGQFQRALEALPAALNGTPFWAGIGAYRLPVSGTIANLSMTRQSQAAGVVLFSYGQLASTGEGLAAFRSALAGQAEDVPGRQP